MKGQINYLMDFLKEAFNRQQTLSDPTAFFELLFDSGDTLQIKKSAFVRPLDAEYIAMSINETLASWINAYSANGIQFCTNAIPRVFLESLDYLHEVESVGQPQWDRVIADQRDQLSLRSDLFEKGRTFFIEADNLPSGDAIKTVEDKLLVLESLLESGLPVSYVLDTGGRGPHIGIVLEDAVSRSDFDKCVSGVLSRLPDWIDGGVGRINQLERFPGTLRTNKSGDVVAVRLLYLGERVRNGDLDQWISANPVISSIKVKNQGTDVHENLAAVDMDAAESAAWQFIQERSLKSSKQISRGMILVSCPNAENHKSGRDRNKSAFINVGKGFVWCSACQKVVGRTFKAFSRRQSPLIPNEEPSVNMSGIKITKIF